jgi:hypothetical protein
MQTPDLDELVARTMEILDQGLERVRARLAPAIPTYVAVRDMADYAADKAVDALVADGLGEEDRRRYAEVAATLPPEDVNDLDANDLDGLDKGTIDRNRIIDEVSIAALPIWRDAYWRMTAGHREPYVADVARRLAAHLRETAHDGRNYRGLTLKQVAEIERANPSGDTTRIATVVGAAHEWATSLDDMLGLEETRAYAGTPLSREVDYVRTWSGAGMRTFVDVMRRRERTPIG